MRKLSVGPLLILLLIFLWNHFASAQALPTQLPAKKGAAPAAKATGNASNKVVVKKKITKRKVVVVQTSADLPKTLPAKKTKVVMDFNQPAQADGPAVVVREMPNIPVTSGELEIQTVQPHEVTDVPPPQAPHILRPALPDSDSYVALPPGMKRASSPQAPQATAASAPAAAPVFVPEPVAATPVVIPQPAPRPVIIVQQPIAPPPAAPAIVSPTTAPTEPTEPATAATAAAPPSTAQAAPQATEPQASAQSLGADDLELQTATPSDTLTAPEMPAPTTAPADIKKELGLDSPDYLTQGRSDAEKQLDGEKATRPEGYEEHTAPAISTTFYVPHDEAPKRRVFIRTGYLDAHYNTLEPDLKNGATTLGISASQVFEKTEIRLGVDVADGMDQEVSLRNTRMLLVRAEGLYNVFRRDIIGLYVGGALGLADIDVNSYHQTQQGDVTLETNAKGDALLAAPEVGARFKIGRTISFDVTAEYLLLTGGSQLANLGGFLGEGALGFSF